MSTIKKINRELSLLGAKKKKVAAYCRVSTLNEEQQTSYELQISYYNKKIHSNPEWEFAGVFADRGISGTGTKKRAAFQRILEAARQGKIDLILTKSIKRFSRNTVDLLNTIRELKSLGVGVYFEQENIYTLSEDGDLMITLFAAFAQDESLSLSNNIKWTVKKRFEKGISWSTPDCFGYHFNGERLEPVPDQAEIVKRIYREFLGGEGLTAIAGRLNTEGISTMTGHLWNRDIIKRVLTNINYTGNLILQKVYSEGPIGKHHKRNHGELDQYFVPDTHQALISLEDWEAVQAKFINREKQTFSTDIIPFQGKVFCSHCNSPFWFCKGVGYCSSHLLALRRGLTAPNCPSVPLYALNEAVEGLKDREWVKIIVYPERTLVTILADGTERKHHWRSRAYDSRKWLYEDRKAKMSFRSTNHLAANYGELACFVKCEECGKNYKIGQYSPKDEETRLFHPTCHHASAPKFRQGEMKSLIADVLGLEKFDVKAMDENLSHATISDNRVTFHFHTGETEVRYLHG